MSHKDTIAAIATPPGNGGVGMIRISGGDLSKLSADLLGTALPAPRVARYSHFLGSAGDTIDTGLVLYFPGPHSFTGENVMELQAHGGALILSLLLQRVLQLGVRQARPGEFSERAFLNGKIDLVQAEAIADLIAASSTQGARAAQRSLSGVFSEQINILLAEMIAIRVFVEAAIDFPEEEIDFLADSDIVERVHTLIGKMTNLLETAHQGQLLRDGIELAIVGRPNVGKSSLLNALAGDDVAIVTDIPGTTRDVFRQQILIGDLPVYVADTAGLRETEDIIEADGVRRALKMQAQADLILLVLDASCEQIHDVPLIPDPERTIVVWNKQDISSAKSLDTATIKGLDTVLISTLAGTGLDNLREVICQHAGLNEGSEGVFSARARHLDALNRGLELTGNGLQQLQDFNAPELLAEDLRQAQQAISEITGQFTSDDLLGEIFSSFCIGK